MPKKLKQINSPWARVILIVLVFAVLASILVGLLHIRAYKIYHDACQKMENIPLKAQDYFLELGDFLDSEEKAKECNDIVDYQIALDFMAEGEYEKAYNIFTQLGDFRKSETYAKDCTKHLNQP